MNKITLASINDVKNFVNLINKFDCDIDLISERYIINAKSIMGIFSLDLSKPIEIKINDTNKETDILNKISNYLIKE